MGATSNSAKAEKKEAIKKPIVKNLTGQKQIISIDGESTVLNAYESKEVEFSKKVAEKKFEFWIEKNIVTIS